MRKCKNNKKHKWLWSPFPSQVQCQVCLNYEFNNCDWMDSDGIAKWMDTLINEGDFVEQEKI